MTIHLNAPCRTAAIAAAFALLIGGAPNAMAGDSITVGKAVASAWPFTPIDVGVELGFFKKHGFDKVDIVSFGGDAKLQQALLTKDIDFGLGSGPGMAFNAKGGGAITVAAYFLAPRNLGIAVAEDSTLTPAGFKGKKLAVSTPGSLTYWLTQRLSDKMGWGVNGITPVPLDAPPARFAALRTHQVDGIVNSTELTFSLQEKDHVKEIYNFGDLVPKFITDVVDARKDLTTDKPDMVRRFLAAWLETTEYMHTHKDKTVDITARVLDHPTALMARIYDWEMPEFSHTDRFDPEAVALLKQSFIDMKELDRKPADSELFTEAFLPKP
jgi:ABC-type nitrate/sulfonate/bicarbonate transport system substrate-binding protein